MHIAISKLQPFIRAMFAGALLLLSSNQAFAEIKASISQSTPDKDEKGNQFDQRDIKFDYSRPVFTSENSSYVVSGGLSLQSTAWDFEDNRLGDVDLIKIKLPFTTHMVLQNRKLFVATITPGLHGEQDDLGAADFRLEGQAMLILLREKLQWIVGLGFSDIFGEPQAFPVLGAVWAASDKLEFNFVLPSLGATYTASASSKYLFTVQPSGGSWSWEAKDLGINNSNESVDIDYQGIRTGIGGSWLFSEKNWLSIKAGIETGRELEISRHSDPDVNATLDLEDAWFVELSYSRK